MDSHSKPAHSRAVGDDERAGTPPLRVPLGDAINGATRSIHSKLNRMVLLRLPLAVPPCTDNPSLYITGLLHLAPIYITFENLWRSLLPAVNDLALPPPDMGHESTFFMGHELPPSPTADNDQSPRVHTATAASPSSPPVPAHISTVLSDVHIPELQRSDRLRADIAALTGWPAEIVEEQLRDAANTAHLAAFLRHIEAAVARHPHVLLAYAWVLYMALFAGGRFIRASLESAGDNFWKRRPDHVLPSMMPCATTPHDRRHSVDKPASPPLSPTLPSECATHAERNRAAASPGRGYPLSFFHFAPLISASSSPSHPTLRRDGEDLKAVFKSRLAAADEQLSDRERSHVVREAECVFENIILLAQQLDDACGGGEDTELEELEDEDFSRNSPLVRLMKARAGRMRDSIALSKEKAERVASQASRSTPGEASCSRTNADDKGIERREVSIDSTTTNSSGDSSSVSTISDFQGHIHNRDDEPHEREQYPNEYEHASGTRAIRKTRSVVRFGAKNETIPELCGDKLRGDQDEAGNRSEDTQDSAPAPPPTPPIASKSTGLDGAANDVPRGCPSMKPSSTGAVKRKGSRASLVQKMPRFRSVSTPTASQIFLFVASIGLLLGYVYVRGPRDAI